MLSIENKLERVIIDLIGNTKEREMNYIYILKCKDGTYYTGWTNNLEKRVQCHNAGKGAKYTKPRIPVELVYSEEFEDKTDAMRREYAIKKLTRKQKELLIKKISL